MSELYIIKEETLTSIADEIREKTGKTDAISPDKMANGVNEVYTQSRGAFARERIDAKSSNSDAVNRLDYEFAFSDESWLPSGVIGARCMNGIFFYSKITDLEKAFQNCGATLRFDLSPGGVAERTFFCSDVTVIPEICVKMSDFDEAFYGCKNLHTIRKIICGYGSTTWNHSFLACSSLKNIVFEGFIARNMNFKDSPLTVASMKSIITHLENYAGTNYEKTYTLTLKSSCKTALEAAEFTDEDKRLLAENGIVFTDETTWITVIDDLKWNLVWA